MRSVRVLRNIVSNYLRFVVGGLLGLVLTPVMVHILGDGGYGLWVTIFSFTGYFGLFDQGIRPSLVRYVSRDHARGDTAGLARTLSSAVVLYAAVGVVTLAVTAVVAAGFPRWFRIEPHQIETARTVIWLAGISVAVGFPFGVFGAALSGLQRYDIANAIGIGVSVVRAVAFVVVLRMGGGLVGLAWTSLLMNLVGHALSWRFAGRLLPRRAYRWSHVSRQHLGLIGAYSGFAFVGALATNIAFHTDALVITAFLGASAVTPFALAAALVQYVRTLVHSATWVLTPTASELDTHGEERKLHDMMVGGSMYAVLLSWPALFALIIFGENLITTWVDARYASAGLLLVILCVPTLISLPQSSTSAVLFGVSRHKGVVTLSLLNALLNLGLSLWWVRHFGLVGVALGTAVPLLLVGGVATLAYGCREIGLPLSRYLWEGMVRPGLVCATFVLPALLVQGLFRPIGWAAMAAAVGACWVPYAFVAWHIGLSRSERLRWGRMVPGLLGLRGVAAAEAGR